MRFPSQLLITAALLLTISSERTSAQEVVKPYQPSTFLSDECFKVFDNATNKLVNNRNEYTLKAFHAGQFEFFPNSRHLLRGESEWKNYFFVVQDKTVVQGRRLSLRGSRARLGDIVLLELGGTPGQVLPLVYVGENSFPDSAKTTSFFVYPYSTKGGLELNTMPPRYHRSLLTAYGIISAKNSDISTGNTERKARFTVAENQHGLTLHWLRSPLIKKSLFLPTRWWKPGVSYRILRAGREDAAGDLSTRIVSVAQQEWNHWNPPGKRFMETDSEVVPKLQDYWSSGVGKSVSVEQLNDPTYQAKWPWSAAFVSWVMKKAGAADSFHYAASHSAYIVAAKTNRLANRVNSFQAFRVQEVKPALGDLVCKSRAGSGATYDNISVGMFTHCDIVTGIEAERITTVGGNVSQSVSVTYVAIDAEGHITSPDYFAVIKTPSIAAQNNDATVGGDRVLVWGKKVNKDFREKVIRVSQSVGIPDPDFLMAVMALETGATFSPSIANQDTKATGLIQFMPSTAKELGTSTTALGAMSAVEQLDYVEKYFATSKGAYKTLEDVYLRVFLPSAMDKPDDHVVGVKAEPGAASLSFSNKVYKFNSGFDKNNDGTITRGEISGKIRDFYELGKEHAN